MTGTRIKVGRVARGFYAACGERYYAHLLTTPTEADRGVRYVLENERVHSDRQGLEPLEEADLPRSRECRSQGSWGRRLASMSAQSS